MKGTIVCCLSDLVVSQFGREKWDESLAAAGLPKGILFLPIQDVDDAAVMKLVRSTCDTLGLTLREAADAFGDHWVNVYSQKMYANYYTRHKTARDFLLAMDGLHVTMTRTMANAHPPRFDYQWADERTLLMNYQSQRGMVDFLAGLIKGVGKHYGEPLEVTVLSPTQVRVVFV